MPAKRRWSRRVAGILLAFVIAIAGYTLLASFLVTRSDARAFRDPETGIQRGAEAFTLGPEESSGAVLFVHGFVGGANNFAETPEHIAAAGWFVEAMRLPGHGTSPRDLARTPPEALVSAVRERAQALDTKYETLVLVGHSMGATLCTLVAAEGLGDKLVLAAPYFGVTHRWYYGLSPESWAQLSAPILPWLYKGELFLQLNRKEAKKNVYSYTWVPARAVRTLMALGNRARQPELLASITVPTMLLHAPGDVAASFSAAQAAFEAFGSPQKQFVELPSSNHHIFFDYDREKVMESVTTFVGRP